MTIADELLRLKLLFQQRDIVTAMGLPLDCGDRIDRFPCLRCGAQVPQACAARSHEPA